jgi:hypothetical protein
MPATDNPIPTPSPSALVIFFESKIQRWTLQQAAEASEVFGYR